MILEISLLTAACFVAFTNGANANFKGVASLYGSGTSSLKTALRWGTLTTLAGSFTALFLAETLLKNFGGRGLVEDSLARTPEFLLSVAVGGALTSFLATRLGFPVSTTHALVGALVGTGALADFDHLQLAALGKNFVQPLIISPIVALGLGWCVRYWLRKMHQLEAAPRWLNPAHFLSGGAASFARGLNDTPKMAALVLTAGALKLHWGFFVIAAFIAIGALLDAENVAETLGKKVTGMTPLEGFAANLTTAALVTTASLHSLPVSTTHVSVGALVGIGVGNRKAHWSQVVQILLAWIVTLPVAALLAAVTWALLH